MRIFSRAVFALCSSLAAPMVCFAAEGVTQVACVGDSITHGSGTKDIRTDAYPAQLGRMLGDKYAVGNFGVSGATLLKHGDKPYQKEKLFRSALESNPQIVIIMLGTNDTKPQNWKLKDQFTADYKNLVEQFKSLPTRPRVFVCLPPPVPGKGNFGIDEAGIDEEIPLIKQIADDEQAQVINVHDALKDKPELLPDRVHPNTQGAGVLAKTVEEALTASNGQSR